MTYAILALIALTILVFIAVGMKFDAEKRRVEHSSAQMNASLLEILTARLKSKGIEIVDGQPNGTPDSEATGVVAAFVMVLICALCGFGFWTVFFLACYGACLYQLSETMMDVGLVGFLHSALNPSASTAQAA